MSGLFSVAMLRQGAAPLAPLCGYPCTLVEQTQFFKLHLFHKSYIPISWPSVYQQAVFSISKKGGFTINQLEKLKAEQTKIEQQIAQEQHKLQRLRNRKQYYEKGERAKRAHRFITRGAALGSIAPEVKTMDEQSFYALMETVLNLPGIMDRIQATATEKDGE